MFLDLWSFETFKHQENTRKITIYVKSTFFFPFWENKKFRAGDGRLAGWPGSWPGWLGWQAGWSWQADLDVGPDLKLDGPASQPAISSPELSQKGKKQLIFLGLCMVVIRVTGSF